MSADDTRDPGRALQPSQLAQLLQAHIPHDTAESPPGHSSADQGLRSPLQEQAQNHSQSDYQAQKQLPQQWLGKPFDAGHVQPDLNVRIEWQQQQQQQLEQQEPSREVPEQQESPAQTQISRQPGRSEHCVSSTRVSAEQKEPPEQAVGLGIWEVHYGGEDEVMPTDLSLARPINAVGTGGPGSAVGSRSSGRRNPSRAGSKRNDEEASETSSLAKSVGSWLAAHVAACMIASGHAGSHNGNHTTSQDVSGSVMSPQQQQPDHQPLSPRHAQPGPFQTAPSELDARCQQKQQQQPLPEASEPLLGRPDEAQVVKVVSRAKRNDELRLADADLAGIQLDSKQGQASPDADVLVAQLIDQVSELRLAWQASCSSQQGL